MRKSIKTKKKYAQALKILAKSNEFSKISVTDICNQSGLSRKGFYYHFADKFNLVAWIFQFEFISQIPPEIEPEAWDVFESLCRYVYKERDFYRSVFVEAGQNGFGEYFRRTSSPMSENSPRNTLKIRPRRIFSTISTAMPYWQRCCAGSVTNGL